METIKQVLMRRDGITSEEADELIAQGCLAMDYSKLLVRHDVSVRGTPINQSNGQWVRFNDAQSLICGLENQITKLQAELTETKAALCRRANENEHWSRLPAEWTRITP